MSFDELGITEPDAQREFKRLLEQFSKEPPLTMKVIEQEIERLSTVTGAVPRALTPVEKALQGVGRFKAEMDALGVKTSVSVAPTGTPPGTKLQFDTRPLLSISTAAPSSAPALGSVPQSGAPGVAPRRFVEAGPIEGVEMKLVALYALSFSQVVADDSLTTRLEAIVQEDIRQGRTIKRYEDWKREVITYEVWE